EPTSTRPIVWWAAAVGVSYSAVPALLLAWWARGLREIGYFYLGLLIYSVIVFVPLQILGARYIGEGPKRAEVVSAGFLAQGLVQAGSFLLDLGGGKIQFIALPLIFGLVRPRRHP